MISVAPLILCDTWDNANIITPHLEMSPRIRELITLSYFLLVRYAIDVVVEFLAQPGRGFRTHACTKVTQYGIEHLHCATRIWRWLVVRLRP